MHPSTSEQLQEQQPALSRLEPLAPLQQRDNRWTPATRRKLAIDENSPEYVERKVKALLNKLTLENFGSVSNQIIDWANRSENEKNGATMILVIKLVFEKAIDEEHQSETYAQLCRKMMECIAQNVQDDNIRNNAGEPIVGGHLFRRYLLNRCQEDFERGWSSKDSAQAAATLKAVGDSAAEDSSNTTSEDGEPALHSDEYYALCKAKRQGLGLVRFLGELFKLQMLSERIMHECIKKLLCKIDNPEEEEIESACKLLTTVGQALDTPKARGHMDIYFERMQMLADDTNVVGRIRSQLLDVIELRQRSWRPRNATAGPYTISQIRERDAKGKAKAAQQVSMTPGESQHGGRGVPEQGSDGRSVAGPTPIPGPATVGDHASPGKFSFDLVGMRVSFLLNKLQLENFDSVSDRIIYWANKFENGKDGAMLYLVTTLIFRKATANEHRSKVYAMLCRKMMEQVSDNVQDDDILDSTGELIEESARVAGAVKAGDDKANEDSSKANDENTKPVSSSNKPEPLLKARRLGLGLIRFIGELFKVQLLTERIMHECIKKLLSNIETPEEEDIESLCKLMTTVGQDLDRPKAKGHMDIYFGRMQMLADNQIVAPRIRDMLSNRYVTPVGQAVAVYRECSSQTSGAAD
ncbi:hypothetical protein FS837_001504 [Tulasnella sp. UAMH 9824]|nr:hypothetical protein FS837_001504 [Tulasnella sp. UAMH 9824]